MQKPNWNQILLVRVRKSSGLAINISNLSSFKRVGIRIGLNLENGALIHMKRTLQTVIESCTESCIVCKRACHMQCSVACNLRLHLGFHIGTRKWEHDNTTGHWSYILWIIPYHTANSLPSTRVVVGHQHNLNMPYATRNKCHNKLLLGYQLGTSTTITVCVCLTKFLSLYSCHCKHPVCHTVKQIFATTTNNEWDTKTCSKQFPFRLVCSVWSCNSCGVRNLLH